MERDMADLRSVVLGVVITAIASPVMAQQQPQLDGSEARPLIAAAGRAVREAAASPRPRTNHRMPKGFLWTGVGLLGYGGFLVFLGVGYGPDHRDCPRGNCQVCTNDCARSQDTLFRGARVFAASGAAVLAVGAMVGASRSPDLLPRISLDHQGIAIQQAIPLRRWGRHAPAQDERR
jgi:hypothetical protein